MMKIIEIQVGLEYPIQLDKFIIPRISAGVKVVIDPPSDIVTDTQFETLQNVVRAQVLAEVTRLQEMHKQAGQNG